MLTKIRSLHLIYPFLPFFSFPPFSNTESLIALFSEMIRLTKLKLDTHMKNGSLYGGYQNQAAAVYFSLYLPFFCPVFKH